MLSSYLILLIKSSSSLFEIFQNKKNYNFFFEFCEILWNFAKFSKKFFFQIYTRRTHFSKKKKIPFFSFKKKSLI